MGDKSVHYQPEKKKTTPTFLESHTVNPLIGFSNASIDFYSTKKMIQER